MSVKLGLHRPALQLPQLFVGLVLWGFAAGLQYRAALGLDPWDVFHQGLAKLTGLSIGTVLILVGVIVLLGWIPLRQRPGIGTIGNVLILGLALDATLALVPQPDAMWLRVVLLLSGIVLGGVATGMYIGAGLGPGPRDGLMTGIARRTGVSIRLARTGIEIVVLVAGFALGGSVGIGTLLYAVSIGPLAQVFLRVFAIKGPSTDAVDETSPSAPTEPVGEAL